jgi:molecular chaperone DnaK
MPIVVRKAEEYFGRPAATKVNADEVVALGAAIQAYSLNRAEAAVAARRAPTGIIRSPPGGPQSTPSTDSLKAQPPPMLPIVSGKMDETAIPLKWAEPPPLPPRPPKPPPAVPKGRPDARAEAPAPPPEPSAPPPPPLVAAPLLIDVTPISLGVEVAGGFTDVLIMANTPVPCDRGRVFRTASDGQTAVVIRVAQGESEKFALNTCLGDVELSGLKAAARGEVQIEVIFEIDADGILNVKAKDLESGRVTAAKMRLMGAETDAANVEQMMSRQERHSLG